MGRNTRWRWWFLVDPLMTAGVAWLGQRWIAGFDIRGPFLVMSPLFAAGIFFFIATLLGFGTGVREGEPKPSEVDLIQSTAIEFGFGPVDVIRQRSGKELKLVVVPAGAKETGLPENWGKLDFDAKRFAVVWTLADSKTPWLEKFVRWLPAYTARAAAMIVAGMNLWLILACHGLTAVKFAYTTFWQREKMVSQKDVRALAIMKDLKAAIAFVRADPMNEKMQISPDGRVATLRRAAVRMGID